MEFDPYNTYVNNHRIVGTVTDMLYEPGYPVNLLQIKTDTVEADKSVYGKKVHQKGTSKVVKWTVYDIKFCL